MKRYQDTVDKAISSLTPWKASTKLSGLRQRYADKMPEDQQILVIPDANLPADDPLWKDAHILDDRPKKKRRG